MQTTKEDYQRLIEIGESMLKSTHEHWHEIPVENLPVARFGQGSDGLFVAVGRLMLGQVDQARDWFAISAQFFLEASKPADTVVSEKRALECALLSRDTEFQARVAQKISQRESQIKPMEYPYVMFLKYTILNQEPEAFAFADKAAWPSRATLQRNDVYGTLPEACKALAEKKTEELAIALETVLQEHQLKSSHDAAKLPDRILCFPAAALLLLAREQGLNLQITSPFIPAALFD